ncbi:exopolysaccharide biosynthesis protein [Pasteurellaceae bacterium 15-036681]|nr:exopolysaccharide biosynthesis protein [Pasteurellaceae bacterium 15-036681]
MLKRLKNLINRPFRTSINQRNQKRLKNSEFSVISSNCNGALILHDLGQKFNSPFVNLYLEPNDFIKYLQNISHYMQSELIFEKTERPYPVGKLDDIVIYFMHYHSEQEAKEKWIERATRINMDNLFVIFTDRDGCSYQNLVDFENLPYPNKVVFTHKHYPELKSAFYIKGFEQSHQVGDLFDYAGFFGKKYYDQFDYVEWFNHK